MILSERAYVLLRGGEGEWRKELWNGGATGRRGSRYWDVK